MTPSAVFHPFSIGPSNIPAPSGWSWSLLTDLARLESGHTPSRRHPEWWRGDIPWISLADIRALDGRIAIDTSEHINDAGIQNSSARVLPAGTVVLSRTASVGFVTLMGRPMATSQDFVNWVCGPKLEPSFLAFLLQASRALIRVASSGAIHKTVYVPTVKQFRVCIPAINAQRRIAALLNEQMAAVQRAQAAAQGREEAAGALVAARLDDVFQRVDASGCAKRRLGDALRLRQDVVHPRDCPVGREVFVGLEHMESGTGRRIGALPVEMSELTGRKPRFRRGDIVYGYLRPYLNKVWIAEFDGLCSVDQYVFSVDSAIADTDYVAWFMRSGLYFSRAPVGASPGQLPRIRLEEVARVEAPFPPLEEQKRISATVAASVKGALSVRAAAEAQFAAIDALPAALLRKAFNGEL